MVAYVGSGNPASSGAPMTPENTRFHVRREDSHVRTKIGISGFQVFATRRCWGSDHGSGK